MNAADEKDFAATRGASARRERARDALLACVVVAGLAAAFFVFVIGHFSADLKTLSATVGSGAARLVFAALYYLLPNLSNYAYITAASHGETPTAANFFGAILYGLVYIAVLLAASTLIFKRRNFK